MTAEFTGSRLNTVPSALDDRPRDPNTEDAALEAIAEGAERIGLTTDDVLAAAPGLLDGRLSPADFRDATAADRGPRPPTEPAEPAHVPAAAEPSASAADSRAPSPETATTRTPRAGTKQARMIGLLERPEGATVAQIAAATGWQHHTVRGAISGALRKKLGLTIAATRTREVGPNRTGAKGSGTVYRIPGSSPRTAWGSQDGPVP